MKRQWCWSCCCLFSNPPAYSLTLTCTWCPFSEINQWFIVMSWFDYSIQVFRRIFLNILSILCINNCSLGKLDLNFLRVSFNILGDSGGISVYTSSFVQARLVSAIVIIYLLTLIALDSQVLYLGNHTHIYCAYYLFDLSSEVRVEDLNLENYIHNVQLWIIHGFKLVLCSLFQLS